MQKGIGNMADSKGLETFIGLGGQVRYRCPECPFDSYQTEQVLLHWRDSHAKQAAPVGLGPTLFDAEDKPIQKEIWLPESLKNL
jgi:hypothetical protein